MSWSRRPSSRAILAACALAASTGASAAPGVVDWERRVVRCTGMAAPSLREESENASVTRLRTADAADRDAARACGDVLRGVPIMTGDLVGARVDRDPFLAEAVDRIVVEAVRSSEPRFFSDGGTAVDVTVPLDGPLSTLLLSAAAPPGRAAVRSGTGRADASGETGVVVDARDLMPVPALAPRILAQDGEVVAGPALLEERARAGGSAAYAPTMEQAAASSRAGSSPRTVRAVAVRGCDVVIGDADAAALRGDPALAEGRVVIVRGTRGANGRGGGAPPSGPGG